MGEETVDIIFQDYLDNLDLTEGTYTNLPDEDFDYEICEG